MVDQKTDKIPEEHINLPRGVFTTEDRQYLAFDDDTWAEEYDIGNPPQASYERRKWIAIRLAAAISDLSDSNRAIHDDILKKVFVDQYKNYQIHLPYFMITQSIGFLLRGLVMREGDRLDDEEFLSKVLKDSVAEMFQGSSQRMGTKGYTNLDVDVNIEGWYPLDEAEAALDPEDLDDDVLEWMFRMGELSKEEFARAVLEKEQNEE